MTIARPEEATEECWMAQHESCSGYTEPESDPGLCECQCHDRAEQMLRDQT